MDTVFLGICDIYSKCSLVDEQVVKILISSLGALTNLLHQDIRAKKRFIQLEGKRGKIKFGMCFGNPDHDHALRNKTWSCAKTTCSS